MVLVNVEITLTMDFEVDVSMTGYLLQHVIEEAKTCMDVALSLSVEIHESADVGLLRGTLYLCCSLPEDYCLPHLFPVREKELTS